MKPCLYKAHTYIRPPNYLEEPSKFQKCVIYAHSNHQKRQKMAFLRPEFLILKPEWYFLKHTFSAIFKLIALLTIDATIVTLHLVLTQKTKDFLPQLRTY